MKKSAQILTENFKENKKTFWKSPNEVKKGEDPKVLRLRDVRGLDLNKEEKVKAEGESILVRC